MESRFVKCGNVTVNLSYVTTVEYDSEATPEDDEAITVTLRDGQERTFTYDEGKALLYATGLLT